MSFSAPKADAFFRPLKGKTTTLLVEGRPANLGFARTLGGFAAGDGTPCTILDLDALYSSNADSIFTQGKDAARASIRAPPPGSDVERELSALFQTEQGAVVIDSLNTLYHLMSAEDGSSRSRRLTFAIASLSYFARTNSRPVLMTMYRRERLGRQGSAKSISGLSDVTASVSIEGEELTITTEHGQAWRGGVFSTRIPSG